MQALIFRDNSAKIQITFPYPACIPIPRLGDTLFSPFSGKIAQVVEIIGPETNPTIGIRDL
jgi:hypothetical protein